MIKPILKLILALLSVSSLAASPAPSSPPPPTPTPTPAENPINQEDIEKIRQAVQQKVKEKLQQITTSTSSKKGFIGTINKIEGGTITINYQQQTWTLLTDQDTIFINSQRNKTDLKHISPGQAVLALGILNQDQVLETKRLIVVSQESLEERKTILFGQITDISQSSPILTFIPAYNKDIQYQVKTDSKTKVITPQNQSLKISQLKTGNKAILIFTPAKTNSNTYYAHKIVNMSPPDTPTPSSPKSD